MTGFGLGPVPGTSMREAADIVMGETGQLPHLPQLPQRGLGSDAIGRTTGLLEAICLDRGPRSWRVSARPQLHTRRTWDRMDYDLDEIQEVWGSSVARVKVQAVGPWSMGAALELPNGHRVLSDAGAFRDLREALLEGVNAHAERVRRRFNAEVVVQLDEPLLADALRGLSGTTQFDPLRPVPAEVARGELEELAPDYLWTPSPVWDVVADKPPEWTTLVDFATLTTPRDFDTVAQLLDSGARVGFGIAAEERDAREWAITLARFVDRVGLARTYLVDAVDVFPVRVSEQSRDYRLVSEVAAMLQRDAGDL